MQPNDAYLQIARAVLERARAPLSAKEIIKRAYLLQLVPPHLHGKTQHKTLTARLSVDILEFRQRSDFFRPWPGRFFLTKYIDDDDLPKEYRTPIVAKRRARQLKREYTAYVSSIELEQFRLQKLSRADFSRLVTSDSIQYSSSGNVGVEDYQIWNFAFVKKGNLILQYVSGKYRSFLNNNSSSMRTIGFTSPLSQHDRTLFDNKYHGALGASISNVLVDLDLHYSRYIGEIESQSRFLGAIVVEEDSTPVVLAVSEIKLPAGCPVITRKLSINDLSWIDQSKLRVEMYQFESWSASVIRHLI